MCISGKITTVPKLFSEHLLQDESKHQIMNVHTKWNCLIPIYTHIFQSVQYIFLKLQYDDITASWVQYLYLFFSVLADVEVCFNANALKI